MDEQTKQKRKDIVGWVIYIAVLLAIIITFRCFLMIGRVPSESMEPTLMVHDWMTLSKRIVEKKIKPLPFRRALISCWGITGKFPWMRDIGNIPTLQRMT